MNKKITCIATFFTNSDVRAGSFYFLFSTMISAVVAAGGTVPVYLLSYTATGKYFGKHIYTRHKTPGGKLIIGD